MSGVGTFLACFVLGRLGGSCIGFRTVEGPSMAPTLIPGEVMLTLGFDTAPARLLIASNLLHLEGRVLTAAVGQGTTFCKRAYPVPPSALCEVDEASVWLLGDNRDASFDSRDIGPVPLACLRDIGLAVVWPPSHVRLL